MPPPISQVHMGILDVFSKGLQKTRHALERAFVSVAGLGPDAEAVHDLEAAFLAADLGPTLSSELADLARRSTGGKEGARASAAAFLLKSLGPLAEAGRGFLGRPPLGHPEVTLLLGVNGSGKTTTAGKLAGHYRQKREKILLAAGDTFRAAAADQLQLWAGRVGAELHRQAEGADPAAVAFDAVRRGASGNFDRVIVDTAGRLQTKVNLMEEIKKVHRVAAKAMPGA
ncbi:MAG: ATP-binding cassette domain-containing protein, partial [bacterium]